MISPVCVAKNCVSKSSLKQLHLLGLFFFNRFADMSRSNCHLYYHHPHVIQLPVLLGSSKSRFKIL